MSTGKKKHQMIWLPTHCLNELLCAGTARILKGALSLPFVLKLIKSLIQPDGGGSKQSIEASRQARATNGSGNDVAVWQPGIR